MFRKDLAPYVSIPVASRRWDRVGKLLAPLDPRPPSCLSPQHQSPNFPHLSNPPSRKTIFPIKLIFFSFPLLPPLPFSEKGFRNLSWGRGVCV